MDDCKSWISLGQTQRSTEARHALVREREAADLVIKSGRVVFVLRDRTEVVNVKVPAMVLFEEMQDSASWIAVERLKARGRKSHDNNLVADVGQIQVALFINEARLVPVRPKLSVLACIQIIWSRRARPETMLLITLVILATRSPNFTQVRRRSSSKPLPSLILPN